MNELTARPMLNAPPPPVSMSTSSGRFVDEREFARADLEGVGAGDRYGSRHWLAAWAVQRHEVRSPQGVCASIQSYRSLVRAHAQVCAGDACDFLRCPHEAASAPGSDGNLMVSAPFPGAPSRLQTDICWLPLIEKALVPASNFSRYV
jgi:hypothetical protein